VKLKVALGFKKTKANQGIQQTANKAAARAIAASTSASELGLLVAVVVPLLSAKTKTIGKVAPGSAKASTRWFYISTSQFGMAFRRPSVSPTVLDEATQVVRKIQNSNAAHALMVMRLGLPCTSVRAKTRLRS